MLLNRSQRFMTAGLVVAVLAAGGAIALMQAPVFGATESRLVAGLLMVVSGVSAIAAIAGMVLWLGVTIRTPEEQALADGRETVRLMLSAMAATARADGNVHPQELEIIAAVYREMVGLPLDEEAQEALVGETAPDLAAITRELARRQAALHPDTRQTIFSACHHVANAAHGLNTAERAALIEIARALGFDPDEVDAALRVAPTPVA